jgi:hypothetical protein
MARPRRAAFATLTTLVGCLTWATAGLAAQHFQADDWITECADARVGSGGNCSIMVPFWETTDGGRGSFALVVMIETGNIGIVGSPPPVKAVVRVDRNPSATCHGMRYCIFPAPQALALIKQLANANLILIDVYTAKSQFSFSLSPKGYQAGIAQIRAWGHPLNGD